MKTLIVLDTNRINSEDFKKNLPGGDYIELVNYVIENNLQDKIHIGITETVLRELHNHKKKAYLTAITNINTSASKIQGTPDHNIKISCPPTEEYQERILKEMEAELSNHSFVKVIKLPNSKKPSALDKIIEMCNDEQKRFNDQLIVEEIRHYRYLNNYNRVFLLTSNIKDFQDYCPSNIEIVVSKDELMKSLSSIYFISDTEEERKLKSFLQTDYAKEMIGKDITNEYGYPVKVLKLEIEHDDTLEDGCFVIKSTSCIEDIMEDVEHKIIFDNINNMIIETEEIPE